MDKSEDRRCELYAPRGAFFLSDAPVSLAIRIVREGKKPKKKNVVPHRH